MKKIAVLTLALLMLAGCSAPTLKTGLGLHTSRKATDATLEQAGSAQSDSTACAVTVDSKGKIVSITFDVTQAKFAFDATGKATADLSVPVKTKYDLKDDYGMRKASAIGKEWFEQIDALEAWATGKTIDEVTGMKTKVLNDAHPAVPDVAELAQTCSMDVSDFTMALALAAANVK